MSEKAGVKDKERRVGWNKDEPTYNFAVVAEGVKIKWYWEAATADPARPSAASCSMGRYAQMNLGLRFDTPNKHNI